MTQLSGGGGARTLPRAVVRRIGARPGTAAGLALVGYFAMFLVVNRLAGGTAGVRAVTYEGFAVPVAIASAVAALRGTAARLPRVLLAAASLLTVLADVAWDADAVGWISLAKVPTLTALMYLPAYIMLFATVIAVGSQWGDGSTAASLETVIVAGGAAIGGYPVLISPYIDSSQSHGQVALSIISPVGDVLVLCGLGLLLPRLRRSRAIWLLTGGMLLWLAGDHLYRVQSLSNTYTPGGWVDLLWLALYAAIAAAMRRSAWPTTEYAERTTRTSRLKVAALGAAALAAPVWLLVAQSRLEPSRAQEVLVPLATASVVMVALVMIRLALLLHAHTTTTHQLHTTDSERQQLTESLQHQAFHDSLTGLPNRAHLMMVAGEMGPGDHAALAFIDLDDFKNVNDTLGHAAGDSLLTAVADRIRLHTRGGDLVARLGGDEFAVLMPGMPLTEAKRRIERLLESISSPLEIAGSTVRVAASIGVAPLAGDYEAALAAADMAMYAVKKAGKGRVGIYDAEMSRQVLGDATLAADLRRAIDSDGLHLEYQPIVSLQDGTVKGCEALLRWVHPTMGPLMPGAFLTVADQRGLGIDLDRWVMTAAVRQIADWSRAGFSMQVNVNASAAYLGEETFVAEVCQQLERYHVPGRLLTIEITEQSLVADVATVSARLRELREKGVRVALDDFGTGYSGLAYLQELPVDVLKLDKSFVRVDGAGVPDGPLLGVVVGLGRALGMRVLAEGIESTVQQDTLRALGCDLGQGWRWTKALRPESFRQWAIEHERDLTLSPL